MSFSDADALRAMLFCAALFSATLFSAMLLTLRETLNKSILDMFSGREFGTGPNSLPPDQSRA